MTSQEYLQLFLHLGPEAVLVFGTLLVLLLDATVLRESPFPRRGLVLGLTAGSVVFVSITWILLQENSAQFSPSFLISTTSRTVKVMLLLMTLVPIALTASSRFTKHLGEFLALLLLGTVGLLLMVSTRELISAFVALELTSISLYILTAFHKHHLKSVEAGLKYFLFGSVSAAFTLYGLSLLYGIAGTTDFDGIRQAVAKLGNDSLLRLALVMIMVGFGFKIASVPFHFWAPDAYHGAPLPAFAFIAAGSKVAGVYLFGNLLVEVFADSSSWREAQLLIAVLAMVSICFGNLLALAQSNVRRLLAYSAIAHGGYALLGLLRGDASGVAGVIYYSITYGLAVLGVAAVMTLVEREHTECSLADFAGLYHRSPLAAFALSIFVLSLAGIPPLAGFLGKIYVFLGALSIPGENLRYIWLIAGALAASVVAFYYYLQILKQAFVTDNTAPSLVLSAPMQIMLVLLALAILMLGCMPNILLSPLSDGFPQPLR